MPLGKVFPDQPAADAAEVECFFSGIKGQQNFRRLNLASRQNKTPFFFHGLCVHQHRSRPQIRPPAVEFPAKQRAVNENALNAREEGRRVQPRTEPLLWSVLPWWQLALCSALQGQCVRSGTGEFLFSALPASLLATAFCSALQQPAKLPDRRRRRGRKRGRRSSESGLWRRSALF